MNEQSNLDRDGLDGIHGGSVRREPAPSYPSNGNQSPPSAKIGFAVLLLLAVVGGGVLYFLLVSDSQAPQTQQMAQADTMPHPSPQARVSLLSPEPGSPKQSTSTREAEDATDVALGTEKTAKLEPHEGQTPTAGEVNPQKRETQASSTGIEPQGEQAAILENQSQKMVGRQEPAQQPSVTEFANERPIGMKNVEKSSLAAGQGGAPLQSTDSLAAPIASPALPAPVTVHFYWNTTEPFDWNETKLEAVRELIQRCPDGVEIIGHTCNIGTSDVNYVVSLGRAQVFRQLLKQAGVPVEAVRLRSAGESHPVADNRTRKGRGQNRRAVIACIEAEASPE